MDESWWFGVISLLFGVAGVGWGVFSHFRSQRDPRPVAFIRGSKVVDPGEHSDITVLYRDSTVPRVSRTEVTLWNSGRGTIRGEDISPADRLRVEMPAGVQVLSAVPSSSTPANAVEVEIDDDLLDGTVYVRFNHINAGEEIVVDITHTGAAAAGKAVGTLVGAGSVQTRSTSAGDYIAMFAFIPAMAALTAVWLFGGALVRESTAGWVRIPLGIAVFALGVGAMVLTTRVLVGLTQRRRAPRFRSF